MSTDAIRLRTAITERLEALPDLGVRSVQNQPLPQAQPDELPALLVVIIGETLTPDGDANHGPPRFEGETVIGISLVEGFETPERLDGDVDEKITLIETALLTDPTFTRATDRTKSIGDPEREPYFEAIARMERQRLFPADGETYFSELRLAITFLKRVSYEPLIPDDYARTVLTARLAGTDPDSPDVRLIIDQAQ